MRPDFRAVPIGKQSRALTAGSARLMLGGLSFGRRDEACLEEKDSVHLWLVISNCEILRLG